MEALRQPIEDGMVTISRVAGSFSYPCRVMLVCAMNPCPCGYFGHPTRRCTCQPGAPARYLSRVSGPLLDRLDLHIEVPPVDFQQLSGKAKAEPSAAIRARVAKARAVQEKRLEGTGVSCNAHMSSAQTRQFCRLTDDAAALLEKAFERLGLSARAYDKVLRVARTIADLAEKKKSHRSTSRKRCNTGAWIENSGRSKPPVIPPAAGSTKNQSQFPLSAPLEHSVFPDPPQRFSSDTAS